MESLEKTGIRSVVIKEIRTLAEKYEIEQVLLFGSRARGDFYRSSDIDLAVKGGKVEKFSLDVKDTTSTLLDFDIVDMEKISPGEFMDTVKREGIVLYEKI